MGEYRRRRLEQRICREFVAKFSPHEPEEVSWEKIVVGPESEGEEEEEEEPVAVEMEKEAGKLKKKPEPGFILILRSNKHADQIAAYRRLPMVDPEGPEIETCVEDFLPTGEMRPPGTSSIIWPLSIIWLIWLLGIRWQVLLLYVPHATCWLLVLPIVEGARTRRSTRFGLSAEERSAINILGAVPVYVWIVLSFVYRLLRQAALALRKRAVECFQRHLARSKLLADARAIITTRALLSSPPRVLPLEIACDMNGVLLQ